MTSPNTIFLSVKDLVHQIILDAQVILFGSRANNTHTAESDWDILLITSKNVDRKLKTKVQEQLFPISVQIGSFINFILVNKEQWMENPSYYALRTNLLHEH